MGYLTNALETDYNSVIECETRISCETAIKEEIINVFDNDGSVDIMTLGTGVEKMPKIQMLCAKDKQLTTF